MDNFFCVHIETNEIFSYSRSNNVIGLMQGRGKQLHNLLRSLEQLGEPPHCQLEVRVGCRRILSETETSNDILLQLFDSHFFGQSCIEKWLRGASTCPNCNEKAAKKDVRLQPSSVILLFNHHSIIYDNSVCQHLFNLEHPKVRPHYVAKLAALDTGERDRALAGNLRDLRLCRKFLIL